MKVLHKKEILKEYTNLHKLKEIPWIFYSLFTHGEKKYETRSFGNITKPLSYTKQR